MSWSLRALALPALMLAAGSAHAADVVAPAAYDWTGFYLGAQAGYGWGETDYTHFDSDQSIQYDGFVGGGTLGYNWQHDRIVLGLEGDVSYSGLDSGTVHTHNRPCIIKGEACSAEVDWFGTGRVRLGYAMDAFLPYITGGVAFGGIQGDADKPACDESGSCGYDDAQWGWTVGGGVEWGFAERWSAKLEYLYVDLGEPDFNGTVSADNLTFNVVRAGINYRF